MNKYSFTYIVGYRHSLDRFNNLKKSLDWVNGFSNMEEIFDIFPVQLALQFYFQFFPSLSELCESVLLAVRFCKYRARE